MDSSRERDMNELAQMDCIPVRGGVAPLKGQALQDLLSRLGAGWQVIEGRHLEKTYTFKNFRQALEFTNRVGRLAEAVDHHPEILLGWGFVSLKIWTHAIGGLHEADFVLAAKADQLQAAEPA